ncbi:MAG: 50S ribosomal protein L18 [Candidatus Micrarchaeaceae archaeon]
MIKRRRREGVTNYLKRIKLLQSGLPRLVVRKSNRSIIMQICIYEENGDRIIASAYSKELASLGWEPKTNTPTAYLTGMLLAKKVRNLGIKDCILDTGLYKPSSGSILFAAALGAKDSGLAVRSNIKFDAKRIRGEHIDDYNKMQGKESKIAEAFDAVKAKLEGR